MAIVKEYKMLKWEELNDAKLGQSFEIKELQRCCKVVYGGIAWPAKRPGFAVVVAMDRFKQYGTQIHEICLLDEFESRDMWELVKQCGALNFKYNPSAWIGDNQNPTADQFRRQINTETHGRCFSVSRTSMLDMDQPYQHILQNIVHMVNEERRELFLKGSRIIEYLREIDEDAEIELELGEYPAIEALAYAVLEMKKRSHKPGVTHAQIRAWNKKYRRR